MIRMTVVAYALIAIGGLLSLLNWGTLYASLRGNSFVSAVPLAGALPLGTGMALLPVTRPFAWLALVADFGTLVLIIALPRIAFEIWSTSRINLLHSFTTNARGRTIHIMLFRRRIAVIRVEFDPPIPRNDQGALVQSFGLVGSWDTTENGFSISGYASDRRLLVSIDEGAYTTEELNYPSGKKYDYDCLDGLEVQKKK
jgi:hypothetical protein